MVKIIKKKSENLPAFDYENGVVVIKESTLEDEDKAQKAARIEFGNGKKSFEPSSAEFMASLLKRVGKFYMTEEDAENEVKECGFKASEIIKMPSPFLTACFEELNGITDQEAGENIGS